MKNALPRLLSGLVLSCAVILVAGCAGSDVEVSTDTGPEGDGQFDSIATDNNTPYNTAPSATEPRSGQLEAGDWDFGSP